MTADRTFDRRVEFDERSRLFAIRTEIDAALPLRSFSWTMPEPLRALPLDQGREGACVGFACANELAARPWADGAINNRHARDLYHRARQLDEWPGEDYEGTSVLAGMKALMETGRIREYRWAFGLNDLKMAVAYKGPAVLGLNWYTGMMRPESDGRIRPTGYVEGGHAILMAKVRGPRYSQGAMRNTNWVWNSWGRAGGWPEGYLTDDDLERLLHERGEAAIPVIRRNPT